LYVNIIAYPKDDDWLITKNNALRTIRKSTTQVPDTRWKTKILLSEHSPIRSLQYIWEWVDMPCWVSGHFVRHKIGYESYVSTQRNDRQDQYDRTKAPQDAPVIHRCVANAQAIINVSKVRLCHLASPETQNAWRMFLNALVPLSPELPPLCVPTCVYRGGLCPEFNSCHYNRTPAFKIEMERYRSYFDT
jgi:hypothetical protein